MADSKKQSNTATLITAHANTVRIAPRKLRLVTNLVKNMNAQEAMTQLAFKHKKGSEVIVKLLKSAIANAEHNFSLKADDLFVKQITCDMGKVMKRYFPRARGSAFVIRRKTSHIHLTLEQRPGKSRAQKRLMGVEKKSADKVKPSTKAGAPSSTSEAILKEQGHVHETTMKTNEQTKMNKVQEKRRPDSE